MSGEAAEFYDRKSGEKFVPRGNNYIRIAPQKPPCQEVGTVYHATFNPGVYDAQRSAAALQAMHASGYNIVRVFINQLCVVTPDGELSTEYLSNVADYLRAAQSNGIFVLIATDDPPFLGYMEHVPHNPDIDWPNRSFMTQTGIDAEKHYWRDLIRKLADLGAPLEAVFGYSLRNEAFFLSTSRPLSLTFGIVTTGNGLSYDMADQGQRQRMMDENLVYWIDQVREGIRDADPTALVGVGFFQPQEPNPTRIGDTRLIRTYPAIWESAADFIDLHAYPGLDLSLDQYVENYEVKGFSQKPIIMGEFGAFKSAYPSAESAAQALQGWQVASCQFGFDGWLLWTWDTDEQGELWNGSSEGWVINASLAPQARPDPCKAGEFAGQNIALGKPARASRSLKSNPPRMAVDGLIGNWWGAGAFAPQWIEINLEAPFTISKFRLIPSQSPDGETVHRIWGRGPQGGYKLLYEFRGFTRDGQALEYSPSPPVEGIQFVKIQTISSPSWVSWREIEIINARGGGLTKLYYFMWQWLLKF